MVENFELRILGRACWQKVHTKPALRGSKVAIAVV